MINLLLFFLLALVIPSHEQDTPSTPISPCPSVMTYEPRTDPESDRWYAKIDFPAGSNPVWLFMNIVLDSKADLLGNEVGQVTTNNNINFNIDNLEMKKIRGSIRFFVKHDRDLEVPPKVKIIRLDGKVICDADNPTIPTTTPPEVSTVYIRGTGLSPSGTDFSSPYLSPEGECGKVKLNNPIELVLNGAPTLEGQWPWQVAIYRTQRLNPSYICGGTLVSTKHVITAAHCTTVKNSNPFQLIDESTLTIYLGKHNLVTSTYGTQVRTVEKITVHPEYKTRIFQRDLSILLLQDPLRYSQWVQPACLWPDNMIELGNIVGKQGSVVGWGDDASGSLKLVMMPVVDQETCIRSKSDFFGRFTSDYTYCAGFRDGRSPCNGDSGGGMVFKMGGSWYLRGLVSLSLSREGSCDPEQFVIFTDLAKFLPWIRQNIAD